MYCIGLSIGRPTLYVYPAWGGGGPGEPGPSEMVRRVQAMRGLWLGGPGLRGGMAGVSIRDSGIRKVNKVLGRLRMGRLECWRWSCGLHCGF